MVFKTVIVKTTTINSLIMVAFLLIFNLFDADRSMYIKEEALQ